MSSRGPCKAATVAMRGTYDGLGEVDFISVKIHGYDYGINDLLSYYVTKGYVKHRAGTDNVPVQKYRQWSICIICQSALYVCGNHWALLHHRSEQILVPFH